MNEPAADALDNADGRVSSHAFKESCDVPSVYAMADDVTERRHRAPPANGRDQTLAQELLPEAGPPEAVRVPLDQIDPNPANPRQQLVEVELLADSIKEFGLLQPVTVRKKPGDRYELLGGHRRLAAFKQLREAEPYEVKWRTIPAVIRSEGDEDRALRMLISGQIHISAWKPKEEAAALERLVQYGNSAGEIGRILHKTHGWASKRLRVYTDSILSGYVQSGKLAPSLAEELLPVLNLETKRKLAEQAAAQGWSQDQIKGQVRSLRLDRQLSQIGKLTRELLDILSSIDPASIPIEATRDLWVLHGRLGILAQGGKPRRVPTVEEAEKAAGVKSQDKPLKGGERRKPGLKFRGG